jgi:hypothetical protein
MRRKLFTLAAGVSAVLCAGTCVLWVRSYWAGEELIWDGASAADQPGRRWDDATAILVGRGGLMIQSVHRQWRGEQPFFGPAPGVHRSQWFPAEYPLYEPVNRSHYHPARGFSALGLKSSASAAKSPAGAVTPSDTRQ